MQHSKRRKVANNGVRASHGGSYVECPVCLQQVPLATMSMHLDTACPGPPAGAHDSMQATQPATTATASRPAQGRQDSLAGTDTPSLSQGGVSQRALQPTTNVAVGIWRAGVETSVQTEQQAQLPPPLQQQQVLQQQPQQAQQQQQVLQQQPQQAQQQQAQQQQHHYSHPVGTSAFHHSVAQAMQQAHAADNEAAMPHPDHQQPHSSCSQPPCGAPQPLHPPQSSNTLINHATHMQHHWGEPAARQVAVEAAHQQTLPHLPGRAQLAPPVPAAAAAAADAHLPAVRPLPALSGPRSADSSGLESWDARHGRPHHQGHLPQDVPPTEQQQQQQRQQRQQRQQCPHGDEHQQHHHHQQQAQAAINPRGTSSTSNPGPARPARPSTTQLGPHLTPSPSLTLQSTHTAQPPALLASASPLPRPLGLGPPGSPQVTPHPELHGQFLWQDFISGEEEAALLSLVDCCAPPWREHRLNGVQRGKAWGVKMDLTRRTVSPPLVPLPAQLVALAQRMRGLPRLRSFQPNEANALDYRRGVNVLLPHVDDRQLSTEVIVNLSMGSPCTMTFARAKGPSHVVRVVLPPRSLQILAHDARYSYTHAIATNDIHGERRVSITFRQSPLRH